MAKNFSFRLDAQGAEQVVGAFKAVAGQSAELQAAYQKLIQSSPQLASVHDGVKVKLRETAESLKKTTDAGTGFAGIIGRAGVMGFAIGAGTQMFESFVESVKDAYNAIPKAGDEIKMLSARLLSATGSGAQAIAVFDQLAGVARRTGAGMEVTGQAFTRFNLAAKDLGATSDEVVRLVEGIQKFAIVSGTSGQNLTAATQQIAQALASGKLQGDELRSVMENMPELAAALAKQLGVSMGALRQMGTDGKLTADVVFPALARSVADIEKKFADMPLTMERATGSAKVAVDRLLGSLDQALGFSDSIARKWVLIGDLMDRARINMGFGSYAEKTTDRAGRLAEIDAALAGLAKREQGSRERMERFRRPGMTDEQVYRRALTVEGPGGLLTSEERSRVQSLTAERARLQREQAAEDDAERARIGIAGEGAFLQGMQGHRARSGENVQRIMDLDAKGKAKRDFDKDMADLEEARRLGTVTEEAFARLSGVLRDRFTKAMSEGTASVTKHNAAAAELAKTQAKIVEDAESVAQSLDPFGAAWKKAADEVGKLIAAMELFEETGGKLGMNPARAEKYIQQVQQNLIDGQAKLADGASRTDSAFSQFFSNAASGFEDAIVKGRAFGDVLKALEQDIARIILRKGLLEPLADAGQGWWKESGKALVTSGFDWVKSFFADGGVMTSRGPLPLRTYAGGGVANSPQMAIYGEGRQPEAYVPLPDGRTIPVTMRGGAREIHAAPVTVNVTNSGASAQQIAAAVDVAVARSHRELVQEVNRGGSAAKVFGRRR